MTVGCPKAAEPGVAVLDRQMPATGYIHHEIAAGRFRDARVLSPALSTPESEVLLSDAIDGRAMFGHFMAESAPLPAARELIAVDLGPACLCGSDGLIVSHDGRLIDETIQHIAYWEPDSLVRELVQWRSATFRDDADLSVSDEPGRFFSGHAGSWRNYAHWLCEGLPRLAAFTLLKPHCDQLRIVLPPFRPGSFQQQTIDLLGIGEDEIYRLPHRRIVRFEALHAVFGIDIWSMNPFIDFAAKLLAGRQALAAPCAPDAGARIYIRRGEGSARRVANFGEFEPVLARHGFTVVVFDAMPLAAQVAVMRQARHVVAEHGAGVANVMFCQPGARVLELFNPVSVQPSHRALAAHCHLRYGFLVGDHHPTQDTPDPSWNGDYRIEPDKLDRALTTLCRTGHA